MEDPVVAKGLSPLVIAGIVTLAVLTIALFSRRKSYRLPPGPRGWPVLGSLLSLEKLFHRSLKKISDKYGDIVYFHLGSVPTLLLSSPEMAREVLKVHDQTMASRPNLAMASVISYHRNDVAWSPLGEYWRTVRKICTQELFSPARVNQFQGLRQREVMAIVRAILERSKRGEASEMSIFLATVAANGLTEMMMNKSYCAVDGGILSSEGQALKQIITDVFALVGAFHLGDYIPLFKLFDVQGHYKAISEVHQRYDRFIEKIIQEHRNKKKTGNQDPEDFIDVLLGLDKNINVSGDTVKAILLDLITANDSSTTTSEWVLAELMNNPETMKKAQEELDTVVGRNRLVKESDIPDLKYLQAVVKETFRLHPPAPALIPHESTVDVQIGGYDIPAKTRIMVNAFAIQRHPSVYEDPLAFKPERFLNSSKDVKGLDYDLLPFGSGRRICPAMNLGLITVQYAVAQLLHTITWSLPPGQKLDMMESAGVACPKAIPLELMAKPRLPSNVIYGTPSN